VRYARLDDDPPDVGDHDESKNCARGNEKSFHDFRTS
jgi:hypothetical protein